MGCVDQIIHKACGVIAFFIWGMVGIVVLALYLAGPVEPANPPTVKQAQVAEPPD
jgi:hypothetical protein